MGFVDTEEFTVMRLQVYDAEKVSQIVHSFKWPVCFERVECEWQITSDHHT